ncbi:MAG: hypothetical protein B1H12_08875 [Desulfobacteraceae bacterium 4484_190.2]|nr:MAG: hypothetical protein B1H12_08875 [Desulfobacteraceae bacterium 4484_190.2]
MRAVFFDGVEVSFDALEVLVTEIFLSKQKVQFFHTPPTKKEVLINKSKIRIAVSCSGVNAISLDKDHLYCGSSNEC